MKQPKFEVMSADGFLHVRFNATAKLEDFLGMAGEIRQVADAHHVKDIVVDARIFREKVSAVQRLQVAKALVERFLGYRVASIISAESFDPHLLAETMARNRGGNVKMTTS